MRASRLALLALAASAAALSGCDQARTVTGEAAAPVTSCTGCHGGLDNKTGAPPRDTAGRTTASLPSVGAHTAHVDAGLDCDACHVKPGRVREPGHLDGTVGITFGAAARQPDGSPAPAYDRTAHTCSNVYCHGAKLPPSAQGQNTTPTWTAPQLTGAPCGSCHGSAATFGAPTSQHPGGFTGTSDCNVCHPGTVDTGGALIPAAAGGLHLNGQPDIAAGACSACHGDRAGTRGETTGATALYAPPLDTAGATSGAKVGAHLRHVSTVTALGSRLSQPFPCTECHVVPTSSGPHNPPGGVVQFGKATPPARNVSTAGGQVPVFTPGAGAAGGSCATTYCHGGSLGAGGTNHTPSWNAAGSAGCGTCHFQGASVATAATHLQVDRSGTPITANTQCNQCHPLTVNADGTLNLTSGNHVNGSVEAASPHPAGWVASASHGPAAKRDLASCQPCHGATFGTDVGGGKSCNACHANPVAFVPGYTGATHPAWQTECTFCHGDTSRAAVAALDPAGTPAVNSAKIVPPVDTEKHSAATDLAVGAHLRHVSGNLLSAPFKCDQCHGVGVLGDVAHQGVGHVDTRVVIGWQLAALGGATPVITPPLTAGSIPSARSTAGTPRAAPVTCANYCHGATISGGAASKTVTWNAPGTAGCGTCHSLPPTYAAPSWHTAGANAANCAACHPYSTPTTPANQALHVNGVADLVAAVACNSCHGSATNAAPPGAASSSASATTDPRVGAHQAHLAAGGLARAFLCTDCHGTLPGSMTHANGTVALAWSALASAGSVTPSPTAGEKAPGATTTCSNYCHGGKWVPNAGNNAQYRGNLTAPSWTGGPSQVVCGSCHQAPPATSGHATVTSTTSCSTCHAGYNCTPATLATTCTVNLTTHVNGTIDATLTCTSCHGTAGVNNAPPRATSGATVTTDPGVGAHQKHLTGTTFRAGALACDNCHAVPTLTNHSNGVVNVAWSTLATAGGAVPTPAAGAVPAAWETTPTCTNYCHGNFPGGRNAAPLWTAAGPLGCNACHGQGAAASAQPPGPIGAVIKHPQSTACADCHAGYTAASVSPAAHMDGTRSFPTGCTACHGELNGAVAVQPVASTSSSAAPGFGATATSKDSHGNTATSNRGVGAHDLHLRNLTFRGTPIACSECHTVPAAGDTAHVTGTPVLTFGPLARTAWAGQPAITPVWNGAGGAATLTCSSTYCHGSFGGGARATPTWAPPSAVACGSCHGIPPAFQSNGTSAHTTATDCGTCHGTGYSATTVNLTLHVNGALDVAALSCNSCHGSATNNAPPKATDGTTVTTSAKVGAHQAHVTGTRLRAGAIDCAACHTVPSSSTHSNGLIEVTWSTLPTTAAVVPTPAAGTVPAAWETAPTCTNYCHGGKWAADALRRGNTTTPSWTSSGVATQCDDCHRAPPTSSAHASVTATTNCGTCHTGYSCTSGNLAACTVNKTIHMNGTFEAPAGGDCVGCHTGTQGARRAVVPEFANTWSHKRSATSSGTVSKYDCAVCHMEGDVATGDMNATWHQNGLIDLRDPDTGQHIKAVSWGGTGAGSYTATAVDMQFVSFIRDLSNNQLEAAIAATMINQCLKCHDSNGAASTLAQVPAGQGGTASKPFGTTISGANYTGAGVTANGTAGGVTDVSASFAVTNSSYHPVRGKQNNAFVSNSRMNAPWSALSTSIRAATAAAGSTTTWGFLISCWDCHSPLGARGVQTRSVTAHGSPTTLRQNYWASASLNLCTSCHNVQAGNGSNHGAGSAWASGGSSTPGANSKTACYRCHGSVTNSKPPRPVQAQDAHGFDAFAPWTGTDTMWPVGATNTFKPYGFMRNAGGSGTWNVSGTAGWRPASAPGLAAGTATCQSGTASGCSNSHGTYTPGGVY